MTERARSRITWLAFLFVFFWLLIAGRLFYLQVVRGDYYRSLAEKQYISRRVLLPERGQIFMTDRSGNAYPVAISKNYYVIYVVPKDIKDKDKEPTAEALAGILGGPKEAVLERVSKPDDPFEVVKKKVPEEIAEEIRALNLEGVGLLKEHHRYYPFNNLASRVLGYVGYDVNSDEPKGFYGLEGYYDDILRGEAGYFRGEKDVSGIWMAVGDKEEKQQKNGSDLYLTIDYNIQLKAEEIARIIMETWKPKAASIVVEDPKTGAIRAMAIMPDYNPNEYGLVQDYSVFKNPLVQEIFEPGSIFKPLTASIAINEGAVNERTTYTDTGAVVIGKYAIRNFHEKIYGMQTMTNVIESSINTGAVFMQRSVDKSVYRSYLEKYGLEKKTGIDLAGETAGSLTNLNANRDIEFATSSFGQGVSVTPMEIMQALSAIANGGDIMKPRMVERIVDADRNVRDIPPEKIAEHIINQKTALAVSRMMVSAVENTYIKNRLGIGGYFIANKTGTAQIPDPVGGGYLPRDKTIQSTITIFPAYDPAYIVFFKMDMPEGSEVAGNSLPSHVKDLVVFLINYSRIQPDFVIQQ